MSQHARGQGVYSSIHLGSLGLVVLGCLGGGMGWDVWHSEMAFWCGLLLWPSCVAFWLRVAILFDLLVYSTPHPQPMFATEAVGTHSCFTQFLPTFTAQVTINRVQLWYSRIFLNHDDSFPLNVIFQHFHRCRQKWVSCPCKSYQQVCDVRYFGLCHRNLSLWKNS